MLVECNCMLLNTVDQVYSDDKLSIKVQTTDTHLYRAATARYGIVSTFLCHRISISVRKTLVVTFYIKIHHCCLCLPEALFSI